MCYNKGLTVSRHTSLHLWSRGTSPVPRSSSEQQSPAPLLESGLVRCRCGSHCDSWTGWSRISSPMISAVHPYDISWMISAVVCVIGPDIFARTAAGSIFWTAAEDFCRVCVSVLAGLGLASTSSRDSILDINDFSDISGELALTSVRQCTKTVWKVWLQLAMNT